MRNREWTASELEIAREMRAEGSSPAEIGLKINRSPAAVKCALCRPQSEYPALTQEQYREDARAGSARLLNALLAMVA